MKCSALVRLCSNYGTQTKQNKPQCLFLQLWWVESCDSGFYNIPLFMNWIQNSSSCCGVVRVQQGGNRKRHSHHGIHTNTIHSLVSTLLYGGGVTSFSCGVLWERQEFPPTFSENIKKTTKNLCYWVHSWCHGSIVFIVYVVDLFCPFLFSLVVLCSALLCFKCSEL